MPDRTADITRIVQGARAKGLPDDEIRALVARYDERAKAPEPPPRENQAAGFVRQYASDMNPVRIVQGLYEAAKRPMTALGNIAMQATASSPQHGQMRVEGYDAFKRGDYATGSAKMLNSLVPFYAGELDEASRLGAEGEYGRMLGKTFAVGTQVALPKIIQKAGQARVRLRTSQTPQEQSAVAFGVREGVPVDAATATGNRFLRDVQRKADESLLGSVTGARARNAQEAALADTGNRMSARTGGVATTPEQAGQGVLDAVTKRANDFQAAANQAYGTLRKIEAQSPIPVDVKAAQQTLKTVYESLAREAELVPLMGDKARAFTALDRLMRGPNTAALSDVDAVLGELKTLSRVDQAFQRTAGQASVSQAVQALDRAVVDAAKSSGPSAFQALMDGRAATVNKFKTAAVFDKIAPGGTMNPTGLFNRMTASKDSGLSLLRQVSREAPGEMPDVGRAYLEGLMSKATAEGGFRRADAIAADWAKLGMETKRLLFNSPSLVKDLDDFFLLAKRAAENPNPSGTALSLLKSGEAGLLIANPALGIPVTLSAGALSKLLHSPVAAKALVQGLRVPVGNKTATASVVAALTRAAQEQGVSLVPRTAETPPESPRPTQ
jgi:hypothetical protein